MAINICQPSFWKQTTRPRVWLGFYNGKLGIKWDVWKPTEPVRFCHNEQFHIQPGHVKPGGLVGGRFFDSNKMRLWLKFVHILIDFFPDGYLQTWEKKQDLQMLRSFNDQPQNVILCPTITDMRNSQYCHSPTQVGSDQIIGRTSHPPKIYVVVVHLVDLRSVC